MNMKNPRSKSSHRNISYAEFVDGRQNSLTWYDMLPGDKVQITGDRDLRSAAEVANDLLASETVERQDIIDLLAVKVLNNCSSIHGYAHWSELAFRLSEAMSSNLTASGNRSLRMRAQRLNYYLQILIDGKRKADYTDLVISEITLDGNKPWDYLRQSNGEWWITSDSKNIHHRRNDGSETHWCIGLPTQMDPQPDGRIAICSLYTNDALLGDGDDWESIKHDVPVVLVFEHEGRRFLLDHMGQLWEDQPRRLVITATRPQVHFARYFEGVLYLLDNSDFGHITTISMETGIIERRSVFPVQVCNDLVVSNDGYYLIDKQQGSVFRFSHDWRFESRALQFGFGCACLQDPVALRVQDSHLIVVSWLTARLTELEQF